MKKLVITFMLSFFLLLLGTINFSFANEKPVCTTIDGKIGWFVEIKWNFSEEFIKDSDCSKKDVVCEDWGRSSGWYTVFAAAPVRGANDEPTIVCNSEEGQKYLNCSNKDLFTCKDGTVYHVERKLLVYDSCGDLNE